MIQYLPKIKAMNTSFERSENTKVEWLTPPDLVKKLGTFDLDPCSPINPPFVHATTNFTIQDNGLTRQWFGRVYLNPPYGKGMEEWMEKLKKPPKRNSPHLLPVQKPKCFFQNTSGTMPMPYYL